MLRYLVLAALLALGIGLGWGGARLARPKADPGLVDSRALAPETKQDTPSTDRSNPSSADTASLRDVVDRLGNPTLTVEGPGTITGHVLTIDGAPVAGAEVSARYSSEIPGVETKSPTAVDLETYARQSLELYQYRRAAERKAITDSEGRFTIEGLIDGKFWISGEAEGWVVRGESASISASPGDTVELVAVPAGWIRITVRGVDDAVPTVATVRVDATQTRTFTWTPDREPLLVEAGSLVVSASTATSTCTPQPVDVAAKETVDVTLSLFPRLGVRGYVTLPNGRPLRQGRVKLATTALAPSAESLNTRSPGIQDAWVDDAGGFDLEVDAPGTYALGAGYSWNSIDVYQTIEVRDGVVAVALELPEPEDAIVVTARGPSGERVEDLSVGLEFESENSSWSGSAPVIDRGDGTFWALPRGAGRGIEESADTKVTLTVRSERFGSQVVELAPDQREVEVVFVEPARLDVRLDGYGGHSAQGLISVTLKDAAGHEGPSMMPDSEGVARFDAVTPGELTAVLRVKTTSDRWSTTEIGSQAVSVTEGENETTIVLPPLYRLAVVFGELGARTHASLRGADGNMTQRWGEIDSATKTIVFDQTPAGRYTIEVGGGLGGQMTVDVLGDSTVDFVEDQVNALRVSVRDDAGKLAQAGFRDGDMIVALDGKPFRSSAELRLAVSGLMAQKEVTATVQRGG
ncbi:MAG: hypothetical protein KDC38_11285, partial [Planctomycetes bacterium]|nr:hypothetical protein [Planctomycetota bacterium]